MKKVLVPVLFVLAIVLATIGINRYLISPTNVGEEVELTSSTRAEVPTMMSTEVKKQEVWSGPNYTPGDGVSYVVYARTEEQKGYLAKRSCATHQQCMKGMDASTFVAACIDGTCQYVEISKSKAGASAYCPPGYLPSIKGSDPLRDSSHQYKQLELDTFSKIY